MIVILSENNNIVETRIFKNGTVTQLNRETHSESIVYNF